GAADRAGAGRVRSVLVSGGRAVPGALRSTERAHDDSRPGLAAKAGPLAMRGWPDGPDATIRNWTPGTLEKVLSHPGRVGAFVHCPGEPLRGRGRSRTPLLVPHEWPRAGRLQSDPDPRRGARD